MIINTTFAHSQAFEECETVVKHLKDTFELAPCQSRNGILHLTEWQYGRNVVGQWYRPAAAAPVQPPQVLKYSMPLLKPLASFWDIMTAPMGKPLPMGFPSVTISGTTSCSWKPQKWLPTRPKPHCTCAHKHMSDSHVQLVWCCCDAHLLCGHAQLAAWHKGSL